MELMVEYQKNKKEIETVVDIYAATCTGIDAVLYLVLDRKKHNRLVQLESQKRAIESSWDVNWKNRLLRKKPERVLLFHIPAIPDDPYSEAPYPACTQYITGAEVCPPFPDREQNELVIAGLYEVLRMIGSPAVETVSEI